MGTATQAIRRRLRGEVRFLVHEAKANADIPRAEILRVFHRRNDRDEESALNALMTACFLSGKLVW